MSRITNLYYDNGSIKIIAKILRRFEYGMKNNNENVMAGEWALTEEDIQYTIDFNNRIIYVHGIVSFNLSNLLTRLFPIKILEDKRIPVAHRYGIHCSSILSFLEEYNESN